MKNLITIFFSLFCIFTAFSQNWSSFRPTEIRKWHCRLAWENVAGATGFEIQHQSIDDMDGYFDQINTTTGWSVINENTTPKIVITDSTALVTNMETNRRHYFRIRATNPTNSAYSTYSYALPVRTGLFPIDRFTLPEIDWVPETEPTQGDFSWYTNKWGVHEKKISDRTRDGNENRRIETPYPKLLNTMRIKQPDNSYREIVWGYFDTKIWDVETSLPISQAEINKIKQFPPLYPINYDDDYVFYDIEAKGSKIFKFVNGVSTEIFDFASTGLVRGNAFTNPLGALEEHRDRRNQYAGILLYDPTDTANDHPYMVSFDLVNEQIYGQTQLNFNIANGHVEVHANGNLISIDGGKFNNPDGNNIWVANNDPAQSGGYFFEQNIQDFGMGHSDYGISIQGNSVIVGRSNSSLGNGRIVMYVLEGPKKGQKVDLTPEYATSCYLDYTNCTSTLNEGWTVVSSEETNGNSSGEQRVFDMRTFAILLDESAEDRNQNAMMRLFSQQNHQMPYEQDVDNNGYSRHSHGMMNMTGERVFSTPFVSKANTGLHGEMYVSQQLVEHGDEIPFSGVNNQTAILDPIHDAYLEGSNRLNNNFLKVEQGARVGYLKFDLSSITGNITSAEFRFRVDGDAGSGMAEIYKGTTTSWTETNLSTSNAPAKNGLLGSTTDIGQMTTTVAVPLSVATLSGGGELSLVVEHVGSSDFWMASEESPNAPGPQLVITYEPSTNVPVTGVTVAPVTLAMETGDTEALTATIVPANATDQGVSWSSSDTAIATVDASGLVTAVAVGSSTITVTTNDGNFTASVNATVTSSAPIVSNITVSDIMEDSFKVSWNLNEGSKGRIEYGTSSGNYTEQTTAAENFLTFHLQRVGNNNAPPLQSGTTYYWRIRTEDVDGNVGYSDEQTTTTTSPQPQTTTLVPIHDAYLQGSTRYNNNFLRVEDGNRSSYMKYDLSTVNGNITSAELHFRIAGADTGVGTAEIYQGSNTNWTETNLDVNNAPSQVSLWGTTTNIGQGSTDVVVPLSVGSLSGGGNLSLIVEHVGSDDFAMASKEHPSKPAPRLVVTYIPNSGSSLMARVNFDNSDSISGITSLFPNPTTSEVQLYGIDGEKEITVIDFSGKLLMETTSKEAEPVIDLSGYAPGIYYMRVESSGISKTFKVVKQ